MGETASKTKESLISIDNFQKMYNMRNDYYNGEKPQSFYMKLCLNENKLDPVFEKEIRNISKKLKDPQFTKSDLNNFK